MAAVPQIYRSQEASRRIALIVASHARLTGRELVADGPDPVAALWQAPLGVVAHGTEADPLFFFANHAALTAFRASLEQLVGMPSRLSAEEPLRGERQALLDRVTRHGFVDDYGGMRVALDGSRFLIRDATVWNLIDEEGERHGQAAAFAV